MAAVDLPGFVADLKNHMISHGFHVHDERHFIETYSMRQVWEIDCHPESGCGGPVDLHISLDVDPRVAFGFEELLMMMDEDAEEPEDVHHATMVFTWSLSSLTNPPDLLDVGTEISSLGGTELGIQVSATDSFESPIDPPKRAITATGTTRVSLAKIFMGHEILCEELERAHSVSTHLASVAPAWITEV